MARPNSPDMLPKRTKKVRLGINTKPVTSVFARSDWLLKLGIVCAIHLLTFFTATADIVPSFPTLEGGGGGGGGDRG